MTKELLANLFDSTHYFMFDKNDHQILEYSIDEKYIHITYCLNDGSGYYENSIELKDYEKWKSSKRNDKINILLNGQIEFDYE